MKGIPTLEEALAVLGAYLKGYHPRHQPSWLAIGFEGGQELRMPWPELQGVAMSPCSHSLDFRQVVWYGTVYRFSPVQAAVVKVLWEAWEAGTPAVGGGSLLKAAGSETGHPRDLFRRHDAWGVMLGPTGTGTFRLYEPDPE